MPLETYPREDMRREYLTEKACAPYCTISCVQQVAELDNWRDPQTLGVKVCGCQSLRCTRCGAPHEGGRTGTGGLHGRRGRGMHKPLKYVEQALPCVALAAWFVFARLNRIRPKPSFTPKWSDRPH